MDSKTLINTSKNSRIFAARSFRGFRDNLLEALQRVSNFAEPEALKESDSDDVCGSTVRQQISYSSSLSSNATTKRRAKVRSIFGQPEILIPIASLHRSKDISVDSLDTLDSGQSMGYQDASDTPPRSYRTGESGIVSGQETSFESSEVESANEDERDESRAPSIRSWNLCTDDDLDDDENEPIRKFMRIFVGKVFENSLAISQVEKALFGVYSQTSDGRLHFSRYINEQRVYHKRVSEATFYGLVQYFAIVLFECEQADDFSPAKTIMNMCFTFYYEPHSKHSTSIERRHYLYQYLKDQPIWKSLRFWSAAFCDAVHHEKAKSPVHGRSKSRNATPNDKAEEARLQENTVFGQLGAFTYYIKEFDLPENFCLQFLKKQAKTGNLSKEQFTILKQNVASLYNQ